MAEPNKHARSWFRFSLATFLFVSLCIAGLIAGYQSGYRSGYQAGQYDHYDDSQITETYSTTGVVCPDLPEEELVATVNDVKDLIRSTVSPGIWGNGTGNEISDLRESQILVITAPGYVHRQIRELFQQLRRIQAHGVGEQVIPALQALTACGETQETILSPYVPRSSQNVHFWFDHFFGLALASVTTQCGRPAFHGKCHEPDFPNWSLDERMAVWPRGSGLAYLALRYMKDGKFCVVAGWRDHT